VYRQSTPTATSPSYGVGVDNQAEVRDFLRTRRSRVTPQQAGVIGGGRRRVTGLRREEVATLAGVSTDYYAKMERGTLAGVSPEVLDAVARALRLDEAETEHLHDLARAAGLGPRRPRNRASATTVRFIFLSPAARIFYPEWEQAADSTVASMRSAAGRNPHDKPLTDLIGELVTRSDEFRYRWSAHNVRFHRTGSKRIHHPDVGDLEFTYEGFELPDSPGLVLYAYTAATGSPTEERVQLLGSLAATRTAPSARDQARRTSPA
jgi:transcriptional regulator with XRE-family HTH domain